MNKYEALYILASALDDQVKESFIEKYSKLVTDNGGEVESVNKWGTRKLAYPINFKNDGYYVLMTYSANNAFNVEFERQLRIAKDEVIRFMITSKK